MKIYCAGPMTGKEFYNAEAFESAKNKWLDRGHEVQTPFDANSVVWRKHYGRDFNPYTDVCDWGDPILPEMVAEDNKVLCLSDAIALLPGWEKSKGSRAEILLGYNLGKRFFDAVTFEELKLEAAVVIVNRGVAA